MTAFSRMYMWRTRGLYITPHLIQAKDFVAGSDQLVICLDGYIRRTFNNHEDILCRTSLLRAGAKIPQKSVHNQWTRLAIFHLDPMAQDFYATRSQMQLDVNGDFFHHQDEDTIIKTLNHVYDENLSAEHTQHLLKSIAIPPHLKNKVFRAADPRIKKIITIIGDNIRENILNADLAKQLNLSESRLVKLFRQQVGIPLTRYRIRYRVHAGLLYLTLGYSVTQAALSTGFASTAHFSRCFSDIFGVPPSSEFLHPPFLEVKLGQDIIEVVKLRSTKDRTLMRHLNKHLTSSKEASATTPSAKQIEKSELTPQATLESDSG